MESEKSKRPCVPDPLYLIQWNETRNSAVVADFVAVSVLVDCPIFLRNMEAAIFGLESTKEFSWIRSLESGGVHFP